jgi:hypothetical protein
VPIARYFATVGSVLVAMLLVANWYLPEPPVAFPDRSIERTTIRIKSARKWPEKIVFNTNQPMPPISAMTAAEELTPPTPDDNTGKSSLEAFAQVKQPPHVASASHPRSGRKPVARWHRFARMAVLPTPKTWRLSWQHRERTADLVYERF